MTPVRDATLYLKTLAPDKGIRDVHARYGEAINCPTHSLCFAGSFCEPLAVHAVSCHSRTSHQGAHHEQANFPPAASVRHLCLSFHAGAVGSGAYR